MNQKCKLVKEEIKKVIRGKEKNIDLTLCAVLAGGHVLIEDIPGVGKTTLALALSKTLSLLYRRMQFTPDVMPSDILGFYMPDPVTKEFVFRKGAVFTNLFLADGINRTSPKTQSALLEVMEEGNVSVDGVTRTLEKPFFVIATQNPDKELGTQKLPDSQLDRFLIKMSMGYPDHTSAVEILLGQSSVAMDQVQEVLSREELLQMQEKVQDVYVKEEMAEFIVRLVEATRENEYITQGISPRGSLALLRMAKAHAFYENRDYVTPEDVKAVFYSVSNHRIVLNGKAKANGIDQEQMCEILLRNV